MKLLKYLFGQSNAIDRKNTFCNNVNFSFKVNIFGSFQTKDKNYTLLLSWDKIVHFLA